MCYKPSQVKVLTFDTVKDLFALEAEFMKRVFGLFLVSTLSLSSAAFAESRKYNCTTIDRVFTTSQKEVAVIAAGTISQGSKTNPLYVQAVISSEAIETSALLKEAALSKTPVSVSITRTSAGYYEVTEAKKCVTLPGIPATEVNLTTDQIRELQSEIDRIAGVK